ncbi:hypothetical protein [Allomuricauda sp. M10]|uniref:hypothetical protein n=1 Tax=Allomuricauda sp. M10 TaxID=2683292 RepID=UPI001D188694|nr:hypothetical protein [Muricauda sp. M10]
MELKKDRIEIASDVNGRDGIGVEIYRDNKLKIEIFRDDTKQSRTISVFDNGKSIDISFELMEEAIRVFKKEIPWDFIDYEKNNDSE